jgi:D-glycero-alpha-D-manno-heptose-7-phosphate kinase
MIISRTPFRISFFGGGTDYPGWYKKHGGAVLATTIDKYCYLTCRYLPPFFEHKIRVVYSVIESCQSAEEIRHPSVRAVLKHLDFNRGIEIHHDGDLPARSGMGSSSSFTVGLLNAMHALMGRMPTKHELAMQSILIEQQHLKETVGSQDQMMAAYGGFNHIVFLPNGEIFIRPVTLAEARIQELNRHLMLFYTCIKRTASDVADTYVNNIEDRKRQLRIMKDLVDEAISILASGNDIRAFGELLNETWQLKRSLSSVVSNSKVDEAYQAARSAGALGGKLTGAGGGGFMLVFAPPERQISVREALSGMIHVPFKFEFYGSQIIFYDREEDYTAEENLRDREADRIFTEAFSRTKQPGWLHS